MCVTLRVSVLLSKAVLPSSEQMHQCVSLAHLGSCSPGSTGLGCNVSVKVRVRVELMRVGVRPAVATSHFIRPQSVPARLSLHQTPAGRSTVNAYSIVGLKVSL